MATAAFVLLVAVLVSRLFFLVSCPPKSILMMVYRLRLSDRLFTSTATGISGGGGEDGQNGMSNGEGNQGGVGRKIGVEDNGTNGRCKMRQRECYDPTPHRPANNAKSHDCRAYILWEGQVMDYFHSLSSFTPHFESWKSKLHFNASQHRRVAQGK